MNLSQYLKLIFFLLLLLGLILLDISFGPRGISLPYSVHNFTELWHSTIFRQIRLPRTCTAILAGVALPLAGLIMQTVFRNPLAGPYVLGLSSGSSLGVALLIMGNTLWFPVLVSLHTVHIVVASMLGSGIVLLIVLLASTRIKNSVTILILGVMLGGAVSAVVNILQYFSPPETLKNFVIWTMGSLGGVSMEQIPLFGGLILAGVVPSLFLTKSLNLMLLNDEEAHSLGLHVRPVRNLLFVLTSILAGTVTGFAGPIGFVGMAAPHIARFIFRTADHRLLIPTTMILGASIMLLSDIVSILPGDGKILPINSVSAFLGIPVVVWVVLRNRQMQ
jgi:iron complex transport system permease protein